MSGQVALYGRLGDAPIERTSQAGNLWATASLAVDLSDGRQDAPPVQWFGVVAFGRQAESLIRHGKGDLIGVSGRLQLSVWTDEDGNQRTKLQVIADTILSARTVRPGGKRRADHEQGAD